jgi:hypothetical protein
MYNGDIIAAGEEGLFVTNTDFSQWNLLQKGCYSNITIHGNKFTALDFKQCQVVTFELCNDKGQYEWKLQSSFDIAIEHRGDWQSNSYETLMVDTHNYLIICSLNKLLVYSKSGKYVKTVTLSGGEYTISSMDRRSNVILSDFQTGKMYSINNILQMVTNNMEQYILCKKCIEICDITVDCKDNLWILHGNGKYFLSKYVPKKNQYKTKMKVNQCTFLLIMHN